MWSEGRREKEVIRFVLELYDVICCKRFLSGLQERATKQRVFSVVCGVMIYIRLMIRRVLFCKLHVGFGIYRSFIYRDTSGTAVF